LLEYPLAPVPRTGKRACLVPEQLTLDQLARDPGAVDRNERAVRTRAVLVNCFRDHLLAGAALAGDQHRPIGARDEPQLVGEPAHRTTAADQAVQAIRADQPAHALEFAPHLMAFDQALHTE
jgi:hypothetical protein